MVGYGVEFYFLRFSTAGSAAAAAATFCLLFHFISFHLVFVRVYKQCTHLPLVSVFFHYFTQFTLNTIAPHENRKMDSNNSNKSSLFRPAPWSGFFFFFILRSLRFSGLVVFADQLWFAMCVSEAKHALLSISSNQIECFTRQVECCSSPSEWV